METSVCGWKIWQTSQILVMTFTDCSVYTLCYVERREEMESNKEEWK
jgi:hypothetical protein